MNRTTRLLLAAVVAAVGLGAPPRAMAGTVLVQAVLEGRNTDGSGNLTLLVVGKGLKSVASLHIEPAAGYEGTLPTVDLAAPQVSGSNLLIFQDTAGEIQPGSYELTLFLKNGSPFGPWTLRLAAGGVVPGTPVDASSFSAYEDLVAEARIGPASSQVARGNHNHDVSYLSLSGGTLSGALAATSSVDGVVSIQGNTSSTTGYGVRGYATNAGGTTVGVYGQSLSTSGFGMISEGAGTAFRANHTGNTGNIAEFQAGSDTVARIDRDGKGYFDGGTQTGGADFAECVKVDGPAADLEPGDVLIIDVKCPRRFARSSKAESPLVAGVYSTKPGVLATPHAVAGDSVVGRDEVPLAVVGIVPTKVCDEGGPVAIGDLLVTASLPGYAKKAPESPKAGTVLGKSLGSLEGKKGVVEVLLGPAR